MPLLFPDLVDDKNPTVKDFIRAEAAAVPIGAIHCAVFGIIGKWTYSFFNHAPVNAIANLGAFACMGAIAYPLMIIPMIFTHWLLNKSSFLNQHPRVLDFLKDCFEFAYTAAAVAASAAILGSPIGPAVLGIMIIPAMLLAFKGIVTVVEHLMEDKTNKESPQPVDSSTSPKA